MIPGRILIFKIYYLFRTDGGVLVAADPDHQPVELRRVFAHQIIERARVPALRAVHELLVLIDNVGAPLRHFSNMQTQMRPDDRAPDKQSAAQSCKRYFTAMCAAAQITRALVMSTAT